MQQSLAEHRDSVGALRPPWWTAMAAAFVALAAVSIWLRPLMPVDETRYATVAWEMWQHGSAWVPHLNGQPYDHKPPLLFWLIHLGWWIGGVGEVWPRLIGPLSTLVGVLLLAKLGQRLWPARSGIGPLAAGVFLGSAFIAAYSTMLMFDMPLLACLVAAWIGLWDAATRGQRRGWALFGAALGGGLLVKGPVALVYTLPALALVRAWRPASAPPMRWSGVGLALLIAIAPVSLWLSMVAAGSGWSFLEHLLVDQTVQRVAGALGHQRPLWWYVLFIPLLALPWPLWPDAWRAVARLPALRGEPGTRFAVTTLVAGFLILCVVHGKQVHYLIPLCALAALLLARGIDDLAAAGRKAAALPALTISVVFLALIAAAVQWAPAGLRNVPLFGLAAAPVLAFAPILLITGIDDVRESARRFAVTSVCVVLALLWIIAPLAAPVFDLEGAARHVAHAQAHDRPVAFVGKYQGEFGFLGRLEQPVVELRPAEAQRWAQHHLDGLLVVRRKRVTLVGAPALEFRQPYKSDELLLLSGKALVESGSALRDAHDRSDAHG